MYIITMKKIAVLMPQRLSEFILALSVVIRRASGSHSDEITLVVPDRLETLSKQLSPIRTIPYGSNKRDELAGFDKAYLLTDAFSSTWNCFLAGIPARRGAVSQLGIPLVTETVSKGLDKHDHVTKFFSMVLEIPFVEPHKWPGITIESNPEYEGVMVLCPGPAGNPAKVWGGFKDLVKLAPQKEMVILGDNDDIELARKIAPRLPHRIKNLAGQTSLEQVVAILSGASVVIANDSGLLQLAGYIGVPVVGIYGSTTASWNRPLGASVNVVSSYLPCVPCFKKRCSSKNYNCLKAISAEKVLDLACQICR